MSLLYASQAGIAEHTAKQPKVYLRAGNMWLHWSGGMLTDKRSQAWSGTIEQARNCRRTFAAAAGCKAISVTAITPTALNEEA